MHQNKGQLGAKFTAQSSQEELDFHSIGHDNAEGIPGILAGNATLENETIITGTVPTKCYHSQCGRGQSGVLALDISLDGDACPVAVGHQSGHQIHHLLQARSRVQGAALAGLHEGDRVAELTVLEEHHVDALLHHGLDLLDHLVRVIAHTDVDGDLLAMVVELLVQGNLQLEFAGRQEEVLADNGAGLDALFGGCVLHLADAQVNGAAAMRPVAVAVPGEDLNEVLDATGLALVAGPLLEHHGGRRAGRHLHHKGVGVRAELLEQALLHFGQLDVLLLGRAHLLGDQGQLLLEPQANHLVILSTVTEVANQLHEDLAVLAHVLVVQHHNSICK